MTGVMGLPDMAILIRYNLQKVNAGSRNASPDA